MTLGEFIKQYRVEHGLSKRAFAMMADISVQQVSNIERGLGNNGKPMTSTMKTYTKIADAVGIPEKDFLRLLNDDLRVNPSDSAGADDDYDILALRKELRTNYALRILLDSRGNTTQEDLLAAAALINKRKEERNQ